MKQLWTFHVTQGDTFDLQVKGNPVMRHDGRQSILKCLCTEEQARELEEKMKSFGCGVEANCPRETSEQREERAQLLALMGDGRSFPCEKCPECAWFDPFIEGLCGAGFSSKLRTPSWEDEVIEERLSDDKFRADWDACPLRPKELN